MSILDHLREVIGYLAEKRRTVEVGLDVEVAIEVRRDLFRQMSPQERADTLKIAHDDWLRENDEDLDYGKSIIDFMKLTGQDWSLRHRRQLAAEMGWGGDINDTAAMNELLLPKLRERLEIAY